MLTRSGQYYGSNVVSPPLTQSGGGIATCGQITVGTSTPSFTAVRQYSHSATVGSIGATSSGINGVVATQVYRHYAASTSIAVGTGTPTIASVQTRLIQPDTGEITAVAGVPTVTALTYPYIFPTAPSVECEAGVAVVQHGFTLAATCPSIAVVSNAVTLFRNAATHRVHNFQVPNISVSSGSASVTTDRNVTFVASAGEVTVEPGVFTLVMLRTFAATCPSIAAASIASSVSAQLSHTASPTAPSIAATSNSATVVQTLSFTASCPSVQAQSNTVTVTAQVTAEVIGDDFTSAIINAEPGAWTLVRSITFAIPNRDVPEVSVQAGSFTLIRATTFAATVQNVAAAAGAANRSYSYTFSPATPGVSCASGTWSMLRAGDSVHRFRAGNIFVASLPSSVQSEALNQSVSRALVLSSSTIERL